MAVPGQSPDNPSMSIPRKPVRTAKPSVTTRTDPSDLRIDLAVRRPRLGPWWALILVPLGLTACSSDSTWLPALREDPVATLTLESADLDRRWETPEGKGFLGKPTHADILMVYEIHSEVTAESAFDEVVADATAADWIFDPAGPDLHEIGVVSNRAFKELDPGWATLGVSANPERQTLTLHLDFGSDPPWSNGVHVSQGARVVIPSLSHHSYITFDAERGDTVELSLDAPDAGLEGIVLASPSGTRLWSADDLAGSDEVVVGPISVEKSGTHITYLAMTGKDRGPVKLALSDDAGSPVMSLAIPPRSSISLLPVPGQSASITFQGRAPQWFSMQVGTTLQPEHIRVTAAGPDGEPLWHDIQMRATDTGSIAYLDRIDLTADGTYTIQIDTEEGAGPGHQVDLDLFEPHGRSAFDESGLWGGFEVPYRLGNDLHVPGSLDRWPLNGVQHQEIRIVARAGGLTTTDGSNASLALEVIAPSGEVVWRDVSVDDELTSDYLSLRDEGQYWLVMDGIGATIGHFTVAVNACSPGRINC